MTIKQKNVLINVKNYKNKIRGIKIELKKKFKKNCIQQTTTD